MNYKNKPLVVFGVSQDSSKYGHKIFTALLRKGFTVYGVNPKGGQVEGHTLYPSLQGVPSPVEVAILVIPPAALKQAVLQCIQKGIQEIWFQPGAQDKTAFDLAQQAHIHALNACFMAQNGLW